MIVFLKGNSKIGLRQAVDQVPYYHDQPSLLSFMPKWRRNCIRVRKYSHRLQ